MKKLTDKGSSMNAAARAEVAAALRAAAEVLAAKLTFKRNKRGNLETEDGRGVIKKLRNIGSSGATWRVVIDGKKVKRDFYSQKDAEDYLAEELAS